MSYKRYTAMLLSIILVFAVFVFSACKSAVIIEEDDEEEQQSNAEVEADKIDLGVSVNFIDLGSGESIFIYFPDGKTMLIDCGKNDTSAEKIIKLIKNFDVEKIDYLILTHPDAEHIGGLEKIINTYEIGKIYLSKILEEIHGGEFPLYEKALSLAEENSIQTKFSDYSVVIDGKDYGIVFLSPPSRGGIYAQFNGTDSVSGQQINDLSPIIYFEIKGVRFIFTGDAGKSQEEFVISQHETGLDKQWVNGTEIDFNLTEVDFLKVSNGGAEEGTSTEFLDLISPRNVVIFAGEGVIPSNVTLKRIQQENEFYKLYRTDVYGTVSVKITDEKEYDIITEKE